MKFGIRTPSLKKRVAARTSLKRYVRNNLGLKAPRGMGIVTNPKKALYNRVYNRTTISADRLFTGSRSTSRHGGKGSGNVQSVGCGTATLLIVGVVCLFAAPPLGILIILILSASYFLPGNNTKRALSKAGKLFASRRFEEAANTLEPFHAKHPGNIEVTRLLGLSLHDNKKYEEALPLLIEYSAKVPDDWQYVLLASDCYFQLGKYQESVSLAQRIPDSEEGYFVRAIELEGISFYKMGKSQLAIETLKRAPLLKRNLDEGLMEIHFNLGVIYADIGNTKEALKHFNKVYSQDATYRDVAEKIRLLEGALPNTSAAIES